MHVGNINNWREFTKKDYLYPCNLVSTCTKWSCSGFRARVNKCLGDTVVFWHVLTRDLAKLRKPQIDIECIYRRDVLWLPDRYPHSHDPWHDKLGHLNNCVQVRSHSNHSLPIALPIGLDGEWAATHSCEKSENGPCDLFFWPCATLECAHTLSV